MRILFDQGPPIPIAGFLREHTVRTALDLGWDRLTNGDLLQAAEAGGFDLLLTTDTNMAYQQNLKSRKIAIVALSGDRWRLVQRVIRKIVAAVNSGASNKRQTLTGSGFYRVPVTGILISYRPW
jgi:hypothetical protein